MVTSTVNPKIFVSKYFRVRNFRVKKFRIRESVRKLKTPIISKQGKNIIIISNHVKDHGRTANGIVHLRTPYIQRNMEFSYWRGDAMREGASKRGRSIFCCRQEDPPSV